MEKITGYKIIGLFFIVIILVSLAFSLDLELITDRERLDNIVHENILLGALSFVLIFTLVKMLFVPLTPTSLLGGYLFGGFLGSVLTLLAMVLSSVIIFYISRLLGKAWVRQILEDKFSLIQKYNRKLEHHGLLWVMFFRIVPIMNHTALNIMFGASRVKSKDFIIGTAVGSAPGIIILSNIGDNITNPLKLSIYIGLFILIIGATAYLRYKKL